MTETQVPSPAIPAMQAFSRAQDLYHRIERNKERTRALMEQFRRLHRDLEQASTPVSPKHLLDRSPYARLLARLETMPVIEQAKGIIMAQSRCGEAEAFDILRRASQRSNVPVRELATRLVASTAGHMPVPEAGPLPTASRWTPS